MKDITIEIPDGEYCENCKMLENKLYNVVDKFGNECGYTRQEWRCRYHDMALETEETKAPCGLISTSVKKCGLCKFTKEELTLFAMVLAYSLTQDKKEKDE